VKNLLNNSAELKVLGDGKQTKSYLHIEDLMVGLWTVIEQKPTGFQVYNIGHDDALTVDQSIGYICSHMKIQPKLNHTGGSRGWVGDSPRIQLDCSKLKKLGWRTQKSLEVAVKDTVAYLLENQILLKEIK
jgi:UDP-glucose 4-epimerase